jgi:hypothetical protein
VAASHIQYIRYQYSGDWRTTANDCKNRHNFLDLGPVGETGNCIYSIIMGICVRSLSVILFFALFPIAVLADSIISGVVGASSACLKDRTAHIFLSEDRKLVYHNDIPLGGTFEFHVVPGSYEVFAETKKKCYFRQPVTISKINESIKVPVKVTGSREVAQYFSTDARYSDTGWGYPPSYFTIPPYLGIQSFPYWGYAGANFSNFYWPGPWANTGLMPGAFPGGGSMAFAKPNLYISSSRPQKIKVHVVYKDPNSNWLAAIPTASKNSGWNANVNSTPGVIVENVKYDYLYYDFRGDDQALQNTKGFCLSRNPAIDKMVSILADLKFKKNEIEDFESYWRIKMPPTPQLCVFPQTEKQMDGVAKLDFSPSVRSLTRTLFVIVPKNEKQFYGKHHFDREPAQEWVPNKDDSPYKSDSVIDVREWGVAFLFN